MRSGGWANSGVLGAGFAQNQEEGGTAGVRQRHSVPALTNGLFFNDGVGCGGVFYHQQPRSLDECCFVVFVLVTFAKPFVVGDGTPDWAVVGARATEVVESAVGIVVVEKCCANWQTTRVGVVAVVVQTHHVQPGDWHDEICAHCGAPCFGLKAVHHQIANRTPHLPFRLLAQHPQMAQQKHAREKQDYASFCKIYKSKSNTK